LLNAECVLLLGRVGFVQFNAFDELHVVRHNAGHPVADHGQLSLVFHERLEQSLDIDLIHVVPVALFDAERTGHAQVLRVQLDEFELGVDFQYDPFFKHLLVLLLLLETLIAVNELVELATVFDVQAEVVALLVVLLELDIVDGFDQFVLVHVENLDCGEILRVPRQEVCLIVVQPVILT